MYNFILNNVNVTIIVLYYNFTLNNNYYVICMLLH